MKNNNKWHVMIILIISLSLIGTANIKGETAQEYQIVSTGWKTMTVGENAFKVIPFISNVTRKTDQMEINLTRYFREIYDFQGNYQTHWNGSIEFSRDFDVHRIVLEYVVVQPFYSTQTK